ncbi:hypothetical protein QBC46DRAFT_151660 [Diplogelasinospora grovesii]|uniref:Uncharacterized protein n=1 Tax=Diplogelasinospora grovesii TaxID=303347 RepID=A0AAN6S489_9PEZI|nr:hypothetical protein QBC46DRAFT_151660 [Diplogelasinospora grovesii]
MIPFRSPRDLWHRQLFSSGAHACLSGGYALETFPWGNLWQATDFFISKRKLQRNTQQCDARLVDLVLEHATRDGGIKDVAILACLHALSPAAGNAMLASLREECAAISDHPRFLRCLILSHRANPDLVSNSDRQTAEALLQLLTGHHDFLGAVEQLFHSLEYAPVVGPTILSASYIASILEAGQFATTFQYLLDDLQQQRRYMSLHKAVSWLGPIANLPEKTTARAVVNSSIPHFSVWTAWRPDFDRLRRWEQGGFTEAQKQRLYPIFDLEGPDTTGYGRATLKESAPGCFQYVRVLNRDPALLDRLLNILDAAQRVPGKHAIELFIFLSVDNPNPIDDDLLNLTETILKTRDDGCIQSILLWLSHLTGFNNRMVALTKVLPVLSAHPALQGILAGDFGADAVDVMNTAQLEYLRMLESGVAENLAMKIHALGKAIADAADWLGPRLPADFLRRMQSLPSQQKLHDIFDSLQNDMSSSTATEGLVREYLGVAIGGREGDAHAMLAKIERNMQFWGNGVDADRRNLAMVISALQDIDSDVHEACLQQVLVEDLHFLRKLLPIVRTAQDNNYSIVDFTRLLTRRGQMRLKLHDCWLSLLLSLLIERAADILVWSAEELPVETWFRWVDDLRILFPHSNRRLSVTDLGFVPQRYKWWDLLSEKYMDIILQLEKKQGRQGNLRWLYLHDLPDITALLDVLKKQREKKALDPLHNYILSFLQPSSPYIIGLVCASLAAVNHATPARRMAFESLCARHSQNARGWSRVASEALMMAWKLWPELNTSDRESLQTLAALLGLESGSPGVDRIGLRMARNALMADHSAIVAKARDLDEMRMALRNQDAARTCAFLEELGVENGRPGVDPDIPAKLSGCVESVGDKTWEMCFPLSQMTTQQRKLAGIDDASRLLLVRVSFLKPQNPAFCIHFFPNDELSSDRNHGMWYVNSGLPDGTVCWAKPTLFLYILSRSLSAFFSPKGGNSIDLVSVHEMVSAVLQNPASHCQVCTEAMLSSRLWRPTICSERKCSDKSQSRAIPLEVRASSLLSDPPVLDLLLTCVYAAAAAKDTMATVDLLPDCPIAKDKVGGVIDSFPALPAHASAAELLSQIRGGPLASDRETLLSWMSVTFRGCLISAPQTTRMPAMPGVVQFLMLNSHPEREQRFSNYHDAGEASGVTFHGTTADKMWRILTEGLGVINTTPSNRRLQGAIPLQDEPTSAMRHSTGKKTWKNSMFSNRTLLLACELMGHAHEGYQAVAGQEHARVAVRYVLLCPPGFAPPHRTRAIEEATQRTFAAIRNGTIMKDDGAVAPAA